MGETTITLRGSGIQDLSKVNIQVSIEATVDVDAAAARRLVTAWLVSEVGNMLIGGSPQLVIGTETVWRVPVLLTSSEVGPISQVGEVDVHAVHGTIQFNDQIRERILRHADLAARSAS
ncbi:MAG: hypothetical protein KC425_01015 [Anaerolineales bacterium]|nr:hypothetical protein [Anaerolineales bacterium]